MANIQNLDVETYVRLLISEKFGYERGDVEESEVRPQKAHQQKKLNRKLQTRQENIGPGGG